MKRLMMIAALLLTGVSYGQVGINAGGSVLNGFGSPGAWGGFHLGVEVPRDDAVSYYGRVTHHFSRQSERGILMSAIAKDLTTTPYIVNFEANTSMNYTILEGGTRYYAGNGYDFGWGAYGGTNISLIFNSVKLNAENYDQVNYKLPEGYDRKGAIASFGFGLMGGLKYSVTGTGTFYFDMGLTYVLFGYPSNNLANDVALDMWSPLFFNFNLGFRKDLFW